MALVAPSPEWAYRVVNSAARSLRRDLKKQGKFGVDAGAPRARRPKIAAAFFKRNSLRIPTGIARHPHVNTALRLPHKNP